MVVVHTGSSVDDGRRFKLHRRLPHGMGLRDFRRAAGLSPMSEDGMAHDQTDDEAREELVFVP